MGLSKPISCIVLASALVCMTFLVPAKAAPDFSVSANPSSVTGPSLSSTITLTSLGGFSGSVNVSASVNPPGPSISFTSVVTSESVILNLSSGGTASTPLFASSRTAGNFTITVTGVSGSLSHSLAVIFVARPPPADFKLDCCFPQGGGKMGSVTAGDNYTSWGWVTSINGFSGRVNLTITLSLNTTVTITPSTVDVPDAGGIDPNIAFHVLNSTRPGDYTGMLTATNGSITHSTALTITVDPALPACPSCIPNSWSLASVFSGLVLGGSIVSGVGIRRSRVVLRNNRIILKVLLASSLIASGVLVTFGTGLLLVSQGWVGLTCIHYSAYGLPFSWREIAGCGRESLQLNWVAFTSDVVFFAASGYVLVVACQIGQRGWKLKPPVTFLAALGYVITAIWLFMLTYY